MSRIQFSAFLCLLLPLFSFAQIHPAPNAQIHYRVIGFSFPAHANAASYSIEVAKGKHTTEKTFQKAVMARVSSIQPKMIAEVPDWGAEYTWRYKSKTPSDEKKSAFYYFKTRYDSAVLNVTRMSIVDSAKEFRDAHILADFTRGMYDMNGRVVWYLPQDILGEDMAAAVEDLKVTNRGTFSFLSHSRIYEVSYNGEILNYMPKTGMEGLAKESRVNHHEATRLKSGHFMTLNNELVSWKGEGKDVQVRVGVDTTNGYQTSSFERLLEYDTTGKIVWEFKLFDYMLQSDIINWKVEGGKQYSNLHANAFFVDEDKKVIYIGLKAISRIVKVSYPEGKVLGVFGKTYSAGMPDLDQSTFCQQHAIRLKNDEMYVFNNNSCSKDAIPTLVVMREDKQSEIGLRKVWEYRFPIQPENRKRSRGGNIVELTNGSVFGSASSPHGDVIIVNRKSDLLWHGKFERSNELGQWSDMPTYRATIIETKEEFEKLVLFPGKM